jgi:hypothetical protein
LLTSLKMLRRRRFKIDEGVEAVALAPFSLSASLVGVKPEPEPDAGFLTGVATGEGTLSVNPSPAPAPPPLCRGERRGKPESGMATLGGSGNSRSAVGCNQNLTLGRLPGLLHEQHPRFPRGGHERQRARVHAEVATARVSTRETRRNSEVRESLCARRGSSPACV